MIRSSKRKFLSVVSGILPGIALLLISLCFMGCVSLPASPVTEVNYFYPQDLGMWRHIYSASPEYVVPSGLPTAIVIPHHDIAVERQNSFYKALAKQGKPSVIVIIGPDHFEAGKKNIVTAKNTVFHGPERDVPLATDLIKTLSKDSVMKNLVSVQDGLWEIEHAVFVHTPFISHYFPDVPVMPVLLKGFSRDEDFEDYKKLAAFLNENLPEDALVIASVDFSHYQIPRITALHDKVTMDTIANMESPRHLEIDSPETITCIMEYVRLRNSAVPVLVDRSSTYDYIPDDMVVSTSHQYWGFYPECNEQQVRSFIPLASSRGQRVQLPDYSSSTNRTILVGGNGNVGAGIREWWYWDRYYESQDNVHNLLHEFAGVEARFLTGFDEIIFDVTPGTVYNSKKHGTALTIECMDVNEINSWILPSAQSEKLLNQIKILVFVESDGNEVPRALIEQIMDKNVYDIVIVRSCDYSTEARLYLDAIHSISLGTLYTESEEKASGTLVVLSWQNSELKVETIDYTSDESVVQKVLQFAPDEY